jgi:hypothetical protein
MACIRARNKVGARSAQLLAKTCTDDKPVRADRRLRADDEAIHAQSAISRKTVLIII